MRLVKITSMGQDSSAYVFPKRGQTTLNLWSLAHVELELG